MEYPKIKLIDYNIIHVDRARIEPQGGQIYLKGTSSLGWRLSDDFDWIIGKDDHDHVILLRLKK